MQWDPQTSRPSRRPWAITLALVALALLFIAFKIMLGGETPPPPDKKIANVEVLTLTTGPYEEALVLPARIRARQSAQVSAEFGARLKGWSVSEGGRVGRGEVVATLDDADIRAALAEARVRQSTAQAALVSAELSVEHAAVTLDKARRDAQALALDLESAESGLQLARANFDRAKNLLEKGVMDRSQLDRERDALTQAQVGVKRAEDARERAQIGVRATEVGQEQARTALTLSQSQRKEIDAAIESLQVRLDKHTLRAPVAGVLEEHLAEPGEVVSQGQPLGRIYDLTALRVTVDVPDRYVPFLDADNPALPYFIQGQGVNAEPALSATLEVPGLPKLSGGKQKGLELEARIVRVAQAADPTSHTYPVELEADNPGGALREGLIAKAKITLLHYPDAVVIPLSAVQVTDLGPRVLVVEEVVDGEGKKEGEAKAKTSTRARARTIDPLSIRDNEVHVGEGLAPGDRLIVSGWKGVVPGEQVNVIKRDGVLVEKP